MTFVYDAPREGLTSRGVTQGTVLFRGRRQGDKYSGTAYIFTKSCGPQPYEVSGPVDSDDRGVTMFGKAPTVNSACEVTGGRDDTLRFTLSGDR